MASQYHRLLDPTTLVPNWVQPREQWFDAGAFSKLSLQVRVLKQQTTGTPKGKLIIQHAAVPEDDAFVNLGNLETLLDTTGGFLYSDQFLRYIRVVTDGNVADNPVALVDLMAKE